MLNNYFVPDLTFVNFVTVFHNKVTVLLGTINLRSSITIGKRADRSSEPPLSIDPPPPPPRN